MNASLDHICEPPIEKGRKPQIIKMIDLVNLIAVSFIKLNIKKKIFVTFFNLVM